MPMSLRLPSVRPQLIVLALLVTSSAHAQQPARVLTAADYDRAVRFLAPGVAGLVTGGSVSPTWLPDDRFWYINTTSGGTEMILVDPARRSRAAAFDHSRMAQALSAAAATAYTPAQLP